MKYDIIGDIHGHAGRLVQLLEKMGYREVSGTYRHPDSKRKAIFVGDFIDRGPKIKETLAIVKSMVDNGAARAVMGNHEYNALCYHTLKDREQDVWLRSRSFKNTKQHSATLRQFKTRQPECDKYMAWFMDLPLFLDLGDIRVVHAAWIPSAIEKIDKWTSGTNKLNQCLLQKSAEEGSDEFKTIETLLKGVETRLPDPSRPFEDKEGRLRNHIRIKWWEPANDKTYEEILFPGDSEQYFGMQVIPSAEADNLSVYRDKVPVFFGHYWLDPAIEPSFRPQTEHICCLDYSVAQNGSLAAYQWDGEKTLKSNNFEWV